MPEPEWKIAADTYPILLIPFSGKVVTLEGVGGGYRIHRKKELEGKFVFNNCHSKPSSTVERDYRSKELIFKTLDHHGLISSQGSRFDAPAVVKNRLISLRVDPLSHPLESDTSLKVLYDGLLGVFNWPDYPLKIRLAYVFWMLGVAFLPQYLAKEIILWGIKIAPILTRRS